MSERELSEINIYCDSNSILLVTNRGRLIRLQCPFKVEFIFPIGIYKKGDTALVEAVKVDIKLQLIYIIENRGYYYFFCAIIYLEK